MKWIGVKDVSGGVLNEGQSLKTFSAQFVLFFPALYLPPEKVFDPFHFNLMWWLVWIKTFIVVLFSVSYGLKQCSNGYQVTKGSPLWISMRGEHYISLHSALHGDLQMHLQVQYTTNALHVYQIGVLVEPLWMFVHLFWKEKAICIQLLAAEQ